MRGLLLFSLALGVAFGCSEQSGQASGTRTNWLRACETEADCDPSDECTCGLCTATCTETSDCESGWCATYLASEGQCQSVSMPIAGEQICLPGEAPECTELPLETDLDLGAPIPATCLPGALLCESFDAPLPEHYSTLDGGPAAIQDCETQAGPGALRYSGAPRETLMPLSSPVTAGFLYARAFFFVPGSAVIPEGVVLFELKNNASAFESVALDLLPEGTVRVSIGASAAVTSSTSQPLPRDQWVCLNFAMTVANSEGTISLNQDGLIVLDQTMLNTGSTNGYDTLALGTWQESSLVEVLVDELIVSTEPTYCN